MGGTGRQELSRGGCWIRCGRKEFTRLQEIVIMSCKCKWFVMHAALLVFRMFATVIPWAPVSLDERRPPVVVWRHRCLPRSAGRHLGAAGCGCCGLIVSRVSCTGGNSLSIETSAALPAAGMTRQWRRQRMTERVELILPQ